MKTRITDLSVTKTEVGWRLTAPLRTGSVDVTVIAGKDGQIDNFLTTVMNTMPRRFGEPPQRD